MKKKYHNTFYIIVLLLALSLSGCKTLRAPNTPYGLWVSPEKTEVSAPTADSEWASVKDRRIEIDSSKPFALGELVDIALRNNPSTQKAWQEARAQEAKMREVQGAWLPTIKVSATADRGKEIDNRADTSITDYRRKYPVIDDHSEYGASADLTYLIADFGGRSASIKESREFLLSKNFDFNQEMLDVILEVEKSYYELYSAYSNLEAAQADAEDAKTSLVAAEQKHKVGLVAKLDVYRAKANYDNSLYSLEEAKGEIEAKKGNLAQVIGLSADTSFYVAKPKQEIPADVTSKNVSNLIEKGMEHRPDVQSTRATVRAKEAAVRVADSAIWPTLNFGLSAAANWYHYYWDTNNNVTQPFDRDQSYRGFFTVNWDIFDGFANVNKKRAAVADFKASREELIRGEIAASNDVWTKYFSYKTAAKKYVFAESFYESANVAYELALESYVKGLADMLDLLDAQSQLSDARSKLIRSREDVFVSLAKLANATGSLYISD